MNQILMDERKEPPSDNEELSPSFSLFLGDRRGTIIDNVDAILLKGIQENNSITRAAAAVGISYRNAWDRIDKMAKKLGTRVVIAEHGGKRGGSAKLAPEGLTLLNDYRKLSTYLFGALGDKEFWQHVGYRLSARNRIRAKILAISDGPIASQIRLEVRTPSLLTSVITNDAVQDLDLKPGDEVDAIVKATEVIIGKPPQQAREHGHRVIPKVRKTKA